jgi:hypothetical protein
MWRVTTYHNFVTVGACRCYISSSTMITLPAELWNAIFDIAADEDIIFDHGLPTVMAESTWFNSADQWQLRAPQESLHLVQRRSYATKKVRSSIYYLARI